MRTTHPYTKEELAILIQNYGDWPTLQKLLPGRTKSGLKYKAHSLGLAGPKQPEWTILENRVMRNHYPDIKRLQTALPRRNVNAIMRQAWQLGLSRRNTAWTPVKLELLTKLARKMNDQSLSEILGCSKRAVAAKRLRLGLTAEVDAWKPTPLRRDLQEAATRRGTTLGRLSKRLGCTRLGTVAPPRTVVALATALGVELYVEWPD